MAVRTESLPRGDPIVVQDSQRSKPHVFRVVISAEGEGVIAVEPPEIGVAAVVGFSKREHEWITSRRLLHSYYSAFAVTP
jgi:hypothetical protein